MNNKSLLYSKTTPLTMGVAINLGHTPKIVNNELLGEVLRAKDQIKSYLQYCHYIVLGLVGDILEAKYLQLIRLLLLCNYP